jgi:ornithine cyclodeaminase/alanine dehydrogenase-like protein (mu-crystallin family)
MRRAGSQCGAVDRKWLHEEAHLVAHVGAGAGAHPNVSCARAARPIQDARVYESSDSRLAQRALEAARHIVFNPAQGRSDRAEPAKEVQALRLEVPFHRILARSRKGLDLSRHAIFAESTA